MKEKFSSPKWNQFFGALHQSLSSEVFTSSKFNPIAAVQSYHTEQGVGEHLTTSVWKTAELPELQTSFEAFWEMCDVYFV